MKVMMGFVMVLFLCIVSHAGQPLQAGGGLAVDRIEQLKKVRMIEALDLSEDQSVRFFARMHDLNKTREDVRRRKTGVLEKIERMVRNDVANEGYSALLSQVSDLDQEARDAEKAFFDGLREILSDGQRAKLLLFERQFQRELQDALMTIQKKRHSSDGD